MENKINVSGINREFHPNLHRPRNNFPIYSSDFYKTLQRFCLHCKGESSEADPCHYGCSRRPPLVHGLCYIEYKCI